MTKSSLNPKVDAYLKQAKAWRGEMEKLRKIALSCAVTEELKWGKPCYTCEGKNVVVIVGFKNYCSYIFAKGALLKDPAGILVQPTENTQGARQIRFDGTQNITKMTPTLKAYIEAAIELEKSGKEVKYKKITEHKIPEELETKLAEDPAFKTAFRALTPGRQRAYILHFSSAKQPATRVARIEKCTPNILKGIGFNEEYITKKK